MGVEYVNGQMLGAGPGHQWPTGYDFNMANIPQSTGLTPPSLMSNVPSPLSSGVSFSSAYRPNLTVHPTPMKSRVETQIPIKLTLFPLPPGIVHLHLPRHTISKPKLLAKPPSERQPDTLELYTMLVCTSAMQNPEFQRRAFARAAALPSSSAGSSPDPAEGTPDEDDENRPLNGGEVKICPGCITRERKRAARKKVKKVEEEESWHKDEHKRAIVFNTHELKDWAPPTGQIPSEATGDRLEPYVPEGALQVDAPMRIACYCRHQNEKLGFQVIFTIKDHQDRLIAQAISSSIMITDDHKTHNMPNLPTQTNTTPEAQIFPGVGAAVPENGFEVPPVPFRASQSSSDLQSLQRNFPPAFNAPLSAPNSAGPSQNTSATMTPRNMSRQASPTSLGGPSTKKRKSSGSGKVPTGLAMTRMENVPSGSATAGSMANPASATSPFMPNHPNFPMGDQQFGPPGLNTGVQPFNTGPPTPNSNDQLFFSNANRSQSMENLAMHQLYSAPTSAHPSRAPSPNGLRNSMQSYQQQQAQIAQAVANGLYGMPLALNPHRPPTIHKMIPNEGPKAGGIEVTCLGSGFCQGLEVMFGETRATTTTFWGETSLVCLLPPSAFAGTVAVTFAHQHAQQQSAFPQQPLPKQQATFKYIDDDEQQIIRLALSVLGHKMNGKMEDVRDLARRIVGDGTSSWGAAPVHSPTSGSNHQMSGFNAATFGVDVEATLLRCLDLVDLDDSPHMPRLNLRQASGQTMLHLACSLGLHRFVAGLLARGANPEPRDKGGYTPMHFAALHDHPQIVRRLILSGADPTMRNLKGYTPADLARSEAVLQSTRRFQHHTRTRSAGSIRSRTSSATSLRSLWEPPSTMLPARLPENGEDEDTSDDDVSSEDEDGDEDISVWMKQKSRRSSAQYNESLIQRQAPLIESPIVEGNNGRPTSPTAAMTAFRDQLSAQLSAQIAHFQQTMHLNLPQMPTLPMIPNLPDYQAYLQTTPMVRRISAMVPAMGGRQAPVDENSAVGVKDEADYRWWDLFSGTMPQAPPAYDDIFPGSQTDLDTKKTSAAVAAADTVADEKCATLFDQTTTTTEVESSASRSALLENVKVGKKHSISRAQQDQLRLAHAEKVKKFRSDRNLFFIWVCSLSIFMRCYFLNALSVRNTDFDATDPTTCSYRAGHAVQPSTTGLGES